MSGLGPQTQAGGFNFAHSQLDSQPNYSFADLTQDGASYDGFADFSGLTQVLITGLRDTQAWMFRLVGTLSAHSVLPMRCMFVHDSTARVWCCRTPRHKQRGRMLYKPQPWYVDSMHIKRRLQRISFNTKIFTNICILCRQQQHLRQRLPARGVESPRDSARSGNKALHSCFLLP